LAATGAMPEEALVIDPKRLRREIADSESWLDKLVKRQGMKMGPLHHGEIDLRREPGNTGKNWTQLINQVCPQADNTARGKLRELIIEHQEVLGQIDDIKAFLYKHKHTEEPHGQERNRELEVELQRLQGVAQAVELKLNVAMKLPEVENPGWHKRRQHSKNSFNFQSWLDKTSKRRLGAQAGVREKLNVKEAQTARARLQESLVGSQDEDDSLLTKQDEDSMQLSSAKLCKRFVGRMRDVDRHAVERGRNAVTDLTNSSHTSFEKMRIMRATLRPELGQGGMITKCASDVAASNLREKWHKNRKQVHKERREQCRVYMSMEKSQRHFCEEARKMAGEKAVRFDTINMIGDASLLDEAMQQFFTQATILVDQEGSIDQDLLLRLILKAHQTYGVTTEMHELVNVALAELGVDLFFFEAWCKMQKPPIKASVRVARMLEQQRLSRKLKEHKDRLDRDGGRDGVLPENRRVRPSLGPTSGRYSAGLRRGSTTSSIAVKDRTIERG